MYACEPQKEFYMNLAAPRVLGAMLLLASICHGQSLADAARDNRKQKTGDAATKVIDSDDLSAPSDTIIHLVPGTSSSGQGTLVAPGRGKHNYVITQLDTTKFTSGGTLHISINVGDKTSEASFDLYPQGSRTPLSGFPKPLASAHNIRSGDSANIDYHFDHGSMFQFAAEGSWNAKAGDTNTYSFTVDVGNP
jgi:hypothetical protein